MQLFNRYKESFKRSLVFTNDTLIPLILCILGATTQVTTLLAMYFSFPTSTTIDLYSPTIIDLPAVTACFYYQITDADIQRAVDARGFAVSSIGGEANSTFDLTLEELDLLTANLNDFIKSCKVTNSSHDPHDLLNIVDCADVQPVHTNLNPYIKCFTFFTGHDTMYKYHRNEFYDEFFLQLEVNMNISSRSRMLIFVHENDEEVTFQNGSPEQVLLDCYEHNHFTLTYYTKFTKRLGPPYSDCIYYNDIHGTSKRNLVKSCIYKLIYRDHHSFHDRNLIRVPNEMFNVTFSRGIPMAKYRAECENRFAPRECQAQLFELKMLRSISSSSIEPGLKRIRFAYPLGLQSNVTMSHKLDFIEYFCYIASVISLWLEVSLLSVAGFTFKHARKVFRNLLQRRHKTNKQSSSPKEKHSHQEQGPTKMPKNMKMVSQLSSKFPEQEWKRNYGAYSRNNVRRYPQYY